MNEAEVFQGLAGHRYIALSTYRKNGHPVVTPVWFVQRDRRLVVWTALDSGKAKRLRNNPCVQLGPSNHSGELLGPVVEGMGRFLPEPEHSAMQQAFRAKYGWQEWLFAFLWKIQGHRHTYIEITPAAV